MFNVLVTVFRRILNFLRGGRKDVSKVVKNHFAKKGNLPAFVYDMNAGQLEELVDAFPEKEEKLVDSILQVLRG